MITQAERQQLIDDVVIVIDEKLIELFKKIIKGE